MNTPFGEPEKLALLQADILLLPNSLTIKEIPNPSASLRATHQLELDMKYALADVKVLVTQGKPLDFTILSHPPALLPISAMLDHVEIEDSTSLVNLVKMIIKALQKHHSSLLEGTLLEHVPKTIATLADMYPSMRYELAVVEDSLTVILCFQPDKKISFCSVNNLLKVDRLVNTSDHCFNIKMEFDVADGREVFKPGGFQVQWSSDLAAMLPELADVCLAALKPTENLSEFVIGSKDALQKKLEEAATAWEERSMALLKLVDIFQEEDGVALNLDSDTMTCMDIIFRTKSKIHLYTVTLYTGNKKGDCNVAYCSQNGAGEKQNWKPTELKAKELEERDLGDLLLMEIRKDLVEDKN